MATETKAAPKRKDPPSQFMGTVFFFIVFLLLGTISASYLATQTFDFGGQSVKLQNIIKSKLALMSEKTFTESELAQFDGSDPEKPVYLAIAGKVYDVSKGRSYYGKDGSYSYFSGKDASRAYVTGCFQTHLTHDLRGLTEAQLKDLQGWIDFYEKSDKYFYVGKVIHDAIDPNSPIPEMC